MQGKRKDNIVEDIAGIVEDFQNTVKVDELEKEDHLLKKDGHFENNNNCMNIAAKGKRAKGKERENTNKDDTTDNIDDKQKGDKNENAKQNVIDEKKCLSDAKSNHANNADMYEHKTIKIIMHKGGANRCGQDRHEEGGQWAEQERQGSQVQRDRCQ